MKKLFAILFLFLSFNAFAYDTSTEGVTFQALNKNGGKLVMRLTGCDGIGPSGPYENLFMANAYTKAGKVINGCWGLIGDEVVVVWENGVKSKYPLKSFVEVKE